MIFSNLTEIANICEIYNARKSDYNSFKQGHHFFDAHRRRATQRKGDAMAYWWVSQGKYFQNEMMGSYLWAPKMSDSGKKIHHWESIYKLRADDIVFSYVDQAIVAVSKVIRRAYDAKKPFPVTEKDHHRSGYKCDLKYYPLKTPLKIYKIRNDLQSILEKQTKNKPINKNGQGNQGYIYPLIDEAGDFIMKTIGYELIDL